MTVNQVRKKNNKSKGGHSHGGDHISSHILKLCGPLIEETIANLINKSISEGIFPTCWKIQMTHPCLKKGNGNETDNWRPVRHVQEVGKLAEALISDQITAHFIGKIFFTIHTMAASEDCQLLQHALKFKKGS